MVANPDLHPALTLSAGELVERASGWLEAHQARDPACELRQRVDGDANRSLVLSASPPKERRGDPAARMMLSLALDGLDTVALATCELTVVDRRRALRRARRNLPGKLKGAEMLICQHPDGGKHDPAELRLTLQLDPELPVEDLISRGMRLLDDLTAEVVAQR